LKCKSCKCRLTNPVIIYDEEGMGQPYKFVKGFLGVMKEGCLTNDHPHEENSRFHLPEPGIVNKPVQPFPDHFDRIDGPLHFLPQYWIQIDDLTPKIRENSNYQPDRDLFPESMNISCRCGHKIGWMTELTYQPQFFIPNNDQVIWIGERKPKNLFAKISQWARKQTI